MACTYPIPDASPEARHTARLGMLAIGYGGLIGEQWSPHWQIQQAQWGWKHDMEQNDRWISEWFPSASVEEKKALNHEANTLAYFRLFDGTPNRMVNVDRLKRLAHGLLQYGTLTYGQAICLLEQEEERTGKTMGLFSRKNQQTAPAQVATPQQTTKAEIVKAKLEHEREMAALKAQQDADRRAEEQANRAAQQARRKAQREALRANAQKLVSQGVGAYRSYKQRKADALLASDTFRVEVDTLDGIEKAKLGFSRAAMFLGAFLLMIVAAWSVGFFFSGMHDFTLSNQDTALIYGGSFALEGIFTGAMFAVAINKKRGRSWGLIFAGALLLALVSMLAQFASYETQLQQGRLQVSDSAIESVPLLLWLIGSMKGHSFLFLLRGGAFHFAEILACLGMPSKKRSVNEQIAEMQRIQQARLAFQEAKLFADWKAARAAVLDADMRTSIGLPPPHNPPASPQADTLSSNNPLALPQANPESEVAPTNGNGTFH